MTGAASAAKGDRAVFTAGGVPYSTRDIIDAAHFRGELEPCWRKVLLQEAAEAKGRASGAEADDASLNSAAIAFRYKYDLITAEETEKWLEARALTLTDFSEYFARAFWEKTFGGRVTSPAREYATASAEERELLLEELTFSGELDRMATRLTWRVAARAAKEAAEVPSEFQQAEAERFRTRAGDVQAWLAGLGREPAWLEEQVAMEAAFRHRCQRLLTPERCERELGPLRLPLTRFEVETMELDSRSAANEAFLCVRDDEVSMEEVAQEGRYPYRRRELVLEEIDPSVQQKYLSSTAGTIMEPTQRGDGFQLARLLGKREPKLEDPDVRARIEQRLLNRHFADLTSGRIQWESLPMVDV